MSVPAENMMVPNTSSLNELHSKDQRNVMDLVDRLRRAGLSSILQLPQIVVCGDQSSGKSSVLEAITEIPFPRKENLCTRFATEIIMRRGVNESICCKINPDVNRPAEEKQRLQNFEMSISDFDELPALIEKATELMGLAENSGVVRAFARDVLSVEITGPNRQQLTLVDLPGLIHAENKSQTKQDVELIRNLVQEYIVNERTVILAVITAKNDYANQIILERARAIDPGGARTLGIITKPDFLIEGSENQKTWFELALNKDICFELGWHMLRNRKDEEMKLTFPQRNANEIAFFSTGKYRELPRSMVGVETLRTRLSRLLFDHLKKELPSLKKELDTIAQKTEQEHSLLGCKRSTLLEQKGHLMNILTEGERILNFAVSGHYFHQFFGEIDVQTEIDSDSNLRRLRAVVQELNLKFARIMQLYGHKYGIPRSKPQQNMDSIDDPPVPVTEPTDGSENDGDSECTVEFDMEPVEYSRVEAVEWALQLLHRSRGSELPGVFNPNLISHLFWEQSVKWGGFAKSHIHQVADHCITFFDLLLGVIAAPEMKANLISYVVEPALRKARTAALNELSVILKDMQSHPITYNHYFTTTLQKIRQEKYTSRVKEIASNNKFTQFCNKDGRVQTATEPVVYVSKLEATLNEAFELDMDKYSAEEALDVQLAYYKDERKYFVNAIAKQVIERHLIAPLPEILAPKIMMAMDDEAIAYLAKEPDEMATRRAHLESQMEMFERGQEAFRRAMGFKM